MKRVRRVGVVAMIALGAAVTSAHVGSPNVFFDGQAGPYPVRVIVRPPEVIPGRAQIVVRALGSDVKRVVVRPVYWRAGTKGAPEGDEAKPVEGEAFTYAGQLWLMSRGAYSVYVTVEGAKGSGTAIIPVMAVATGQLPLSRGLAAILIPLGLVLFAGLVTIVKAASGESTVPVGEPIDAKARRRGRMAAAISVPVMAVAIFGGAKWWDAVDRDYNRTLYRPLAVGASVASGTLTLVVTDTGTPRLNLAPVMPDHGKMMHLFLVRDPDAAAFAHLHPVQDSAMRFSTKLPALPAGRYRLFGDVVLETGSTYTVTTVVELPEIAAGVVADPDDASAVLTPTKASLGARAPLSNGAFLEWTGSSPSDIRITVRDAKNGIATVEPYMGMEAHAVVMRDDASVYVHLHPSGTIPVGAQQAFMLRERGDTTERGRLIVNERSASMPMHYMPMPGLVAFPYEFPKPGRYHVWIQVRMDGKVQTGLFDVEVGA